MSTPYDKDKPGGNSSFGNANRPPDIQGDEPENQAEPRDPAKQQGEGRAPVGGKPQSQSQREPGQPQQQGGQPPANQRQDG